MLSIGILAGLVAMLCWGIADFIQAVIVKKLGTNKAFLISGAIGLVLSVLMIIGYLKFGGAVKLDSFLISVLFIGCILQVVASYYFYKAFEIGEVSIVAPVSGTYSLITVILAVLFLGEVLSYLKVISVILIICGIVLVSTDLSKIRQIRTVKGVNEALIAVALWGVYFFLLGLVKNLFLASYGLSDAKVVLGFNIFLITNFFVAGFTLIAALIMKVKVSKKDLSSKKIIMMLAANAILYTVAWIAMNYGLVSDMVSILAPVSSLYPAITALLAAIVLKEKLVKNQYIGLFIILAGIFMLGF